MSKKIDKTELTAAILEVRNRLLSAKEDDERRYWRRELRQLLNLEEQESRKQEADILANLFLRFIDKSDPIRFGDTREILTTIKNVEGLPDITVRRGFYDNVNKKNEPDPEVKGFGEHKISEKHYLLVAEAKSWYRVTEADIRLIPTMIRDYFPSKMKNQKITNSLTWRVMFPTEKRPRELVFAAVKESKHFNNMPKSELLTLLTFFIQEEEKAARPGFRENHPFSEPRRRKDTLNP